MPEDNIVVTYDALYACDIAEIEHRAVERYKMQEHHDRIFREKERKMIRKEQEERRRYFLNQKLIGVFLLAAAVLLTVLVDLTCIVGAIPAIGLIATKKMMIVNDYWRTHGGAGQWSQEN
ncbi:MAG: hypothetical protein LUI14_05840 [Lachnospiraceae bacterium]|nr:hypothetical protein [Lachnospiraceae bacterium]